MTMVTVDKREVKPPPSQCTVDLRRQEVEIQSHTPLGHDKEAEMDVDRSPSFLSQACIAWLTENMNKYGFFLKTTQPPPSQASISRGMRGPLVKRSRKSSKI